MVQDKIMKKLYNYLYNCQFNSDIMWLNKCDKSIIEFITVNSESYKAYNDGNSWEEHIKKKMMKRCTPYIKVLGHIKKFNISESDVLFVYKKAQTDKQNIHKNMDKVENIIKRDNKCIRKQGSGHSNANKIRYPRKARPLHVWKKFYELFPYQAEIDNWDGKTSDKMK